MSQQSDDDSLRELVTGEMHWELWLYIATDLLTYEEKTVEMRTWQVLVSADLESGCALEPAYVIISLTNMHLTSLLLPVLTEPWLVATQSWFVRRVWEPYKKLN